MDIPELYEEIRRFVREKVLYVANAKTVLDTASSLLKEGGNNLRPRMILKIEIFMENLTRQIDEFENLKFFEFETTFVMEKYHDLNKTVVSMPFFASDKSAFKNHSKKKREAVVEFDQKMKQYPTLRNLRRSSTRPVASVDDRPRVSPPPCVCGNASEFIKDEDRAVCAVCSAEQSLISNTSSFSDVGRVNMSSKYTYNRKIHFRDCMMQYQGKQKTNIPAEIYAVINSELVKRKMVDPTIKDQTKKYEKVTRIMVLDILKSLNLDSVKKYYDDIVLIHYMLTNQECPDIEYLEDVLLDDFDKLTETYDAMMAEPPLVGDEGLSAKRKNFINAQFVLYQLLRKHGYACSDMDFLTLKKSERKRFHHDVCKSLFTSLGWKYSYSI